MGTGAFTPADFWTAYEMSVIGECARLNEKKTTFTYVD